MGVDALVDLLLVLLAALGVAALATRLGRALFRVAMNAAEATAVSGLADVSERRGDITGFLERRASQTGLRRSRRRDAAFAAGYFLLLAIPPFLGAAAPVYAAAAVLWLVPVRPLRPPSLAPAARPDARADIVEDPHAPG